MGWLCGGDRVGAQTLGDREAGKGSKGGQKAPNNELKGDDSSVVRGEEPSRGPTERAPEREWGRGSLSKGR